MSYSVKQTVKIVKLILSNTYVYVISSILHISTYSQSFVGLIPNKVSTQIVNNYKEYR